MEGTKPRTVSSLGMFDLLKGIGMLAIVFAHTAELYPLGTDDVTPFAFALFAYREALMAAFFIASGYGFRKRSIHKCIEQQVKTLLKPYLYTAAATTVLHCLIHHAAFGSWPNAITQSGKVLGGFLLGLPHTASYFGQEFFSCGPMWYLLSLMIAWILLDVILNIFPSLDTGVCAMSVRKFNQLAASLPDTVVLAISKDLPFAHARFCTVEGIENLVPLSDFRHSDFDENYGVLMADGPLQGLLARSVVVIDREGKVVYTELVPEITQEPDYDRAVEAAKRA